MDNWYVYRHIRLDKNEPFYIGIGCKKNYARAYDVVKRSDYWLKIYNKSEFKTEIIFDGLTKEQASEKEKEFISLYGRKDLCKGSLCNLTDGGDGIWNCIRSEETKNKLRDQKLGEKNHRYGIKQSEDTKQKRRVAMLGQQRSEDTKRKQSLSSIISGQAKLTEVKIIGTEDSLGVYHSMSEACRAAGLNPAKYSGKASMVARGIRVSVKGFVFNYLLA
jgi:hypothetical protein